MTTNLGCDSQEDALQGEIARLGNQVAQLEAELVVARRDASRYFDENGELTGYRDRLKSAEAELAARDEALAKLEADVVRVTSPTLCEAIDTCLAAAEALRPMTRTEVVDALDLLREEATDD